MRVGHCDSPKKYGEFGVTRGVMVNLFQNLFQLSDNLPQKLWHKLPFPSFNVDF